MKFANICLFFIIISITTQLPASSNATDKAHSKDKTSIDSHTVKEEAQGVKEETSEQTENTKKEDPAQKGPRSKVAVIVNAENPLTNLSSKQIELIFSGDAGNWRALYGEDFLLRTYIPKEESKPYQVFSSAIMNERPFSLNSVTVDGHDNLLAIVSRKTNAIAFVKYPFYKTEGIKVLAIDSIPPQASNYKLIEKAAPSHDEQDAE